MNKGQFAALLPIILGGLISEIIAKTEYSASEVFSRLYASSLYALMEIEETKLWTFSVPHLLDLFLEEIATGTLTLPDY